MNLPFYKYQGTGNDFILLDGTRIPDFPETDQSLIERLCDRRFGIGADGLIILKKHPELDFEMVYFNSDGRPSSMCGNGGRCIARFAADLGWVGEKTRFMAIDGEHEALISPDEVQLKMIDAPSIKSLGPDQYEIFTGSPHFIWLNHWVGDAHFVEQARQIRNQPQYREAGINVNFTGDSRAAVLRMRTFERGVEDETLSCGTGVTAAALAKAFATGLQQGEIPIQAMGGQLRVRFIRNANGAFEDIWLCGPATYVFSGEISLD